MNSYEKAVFLDFMLNNLNHLKSNSKIVGGKILQFGYRQNHPITTVCNHVVSYDLSSADDDGIAAQKIALQQYVPHTLSGTVSPKNAGLFEVGVDEEGTTYGVREKSIATMSNPLPHVFEVFCYEPMDEEFDISKTKGQTFKLVFNKANGSVWTLNDMIAISPVVNPATATI